MKTAAVFIIYNPDIDELINNILQTIDHVEQVILWFNSEAVIHLPLNYENKVVRISGNGNEFIAKPLNKVLQYCHENKIEYLLTMDQDSEWMDLKGFLKYVENNITEDAIVYAPNINGNIKSTKEVLEVETVITSGSLYVVSKSLALGGFREDYKIYWVDGEFSYWARKNNYRLYCLTKFELQHKFGDTTKKVLGVRGANYSPIVYYFLFRNMFWMHREHGTGAVSYKTILYTMKLFVPGIILCESNKLNKLYKVLKGTIEGVFTKIKIRE